MKCRIFVAALLVIAAAFAGRWMTGGGSSPHSEGGREVTRKTFTLDAGASVEVRGINGPVEIKTADTDTADVQVVRTGSAEGLAHSNLTIEGSPSSLVVSCENNDGGRGFFRWLWGTGNVRQEVTLTLPRRVELTTKGVNGPVRVGEVEGPVSVEGVNGRVEIAGASGRVSVRGVNGQVKFAVARLGSEGMEIRGVNGNVEVRLRELVNADIDVKGNNGGMTLNVPNVTMQEREGHSNMRARVGAGGAQIDIKGVNGQIRFESDATASVTNTATTKTTTTTTTTHAPDSDDGDEDVLEPPPPPAPPAQ